MLSKWKLHGKILPHFKHVLCNFNGTEPIFTDLSANSAPILVEYSYLYVPYTHGSFVWIAIIWIKTDKSFIRKQINTHTSYNIQQLIVGFFSILILLSDLNIFWCITCVLSVCPGYFGSFPFSQSMFLFNPLTPKRRTVRRYKKSLGCRTDVPYVVTKKFFLSILVKLFFGHVRQKL